MIYIAAAYHISEEPRRWFIAIYLSDLTHCRSGGISELSVPIHTKFGQGRRQSSLLGTCLGLKYIALIGNWAIQKWLSLWLKTEAKSGTFHPPVKLRERWVKCLSDVVNLIYDQTSEILMVEVRSTSYEISCLVKHFSNKTKQNDYDIVYVGWTNKSVAPAHIFVNMSS